MSEHEGFVTSVVDYYTGRFIEFGATARGVDWNGAESQELRFAQLLKIRLREGTFSLNDYGCGYGALAGYLIGRTRDFRYTGFDLSAPMLEEARRLFRDEPGVRFVRTEGELPIGDYTVASGLFNVRLDTGTATWTCYVFDTLDRLWELSALGMAFNVLTSYSDPDRMRPDLYYADPLLFFDRCKRRYSKQVALLHDYGLYEFTLLVRREDSV
jgi:SAM-dependent methyltransferase